MQAINGMESMDDTCFGASSELIFAPIDKTIPNDAVLLSSGFRIISMGSRTVCSNPSIFAHLLNSDTCYFLDFYHITSKTLSTVDTSVVFIIVSPY